MGLASWIERRKIPYPMELLRLLRLGDRAERKEHSAERNADEFFYHAFSFLVFLPIALRSMLPAIL
jgi:hypothetical protein